MKNKIVLITGGASGIGLATAKKISKDNKVIIADYKNIEQDFIKNNFDNYENISQVLTVDGGFTLDLNTKRNMINLLVS